MLRRLLYISLIHSILLLTSCKKGLVRDVDAINPTPDTSSVVVVDTLFSYPAHFPKPVYDFSQNPLNSKKIQLGRMLFYDPILSRDSTISCANCHQPFAAFAHLAHPLSHGISRNLGTRNTPALFNLAWMPTFMHDGGINHIEVQPLAPISDPNELDETLPNVLRKLNNHTVYRLKFKEAFGKDSIDSQQMLKAMAQFMLTLVSFNSKYDQYKKGEVQLTDREIEGMKIVQQKCTPCHGGELFTDYSYRNIGLDSTSGITTDLGRELITKQASDRRKFKVPTLRNFTLTSPYFHNGTSYGLVDVLAHHDSLIQDNSNLDPLLKQYGKTGIKLSSYEIQRIYDFIKTLTDPSIGTNPAFTTPFDRYDPIH